MAEIETYMSRRFPAWSVTGDRRVCPTGDAYVVLTCGGIREEGAPHRAWTTDIEKAVELFKYEFDKYSAELTGALYWRRRPEIHADETLSGRLCTITARFAISDKPCLPIPKEET